MSAGQTPSTTRARHGARLGLCAALSLVSTACSGPVLNPQGPVGSGERIILLDSLAVMLCIVVPTIGAALAFGWWFRAGNERARRRPEFTFSGRLELLMWSIPVLVIMFLGGIAWVGSHELDPAKPIQSNIRPLDVEVVSLDWKWLFIYPKQGVASVNRLPLPAGVPVRFHITSASVMNAFFIPRLGSMIYAMNGMATTLNLRADHPGTYHGLSAHFSGDGFADMHFDAVAMPPAAFAAWVTAVHGNGQALDDQSYRRLEQQSKNVAPFAFGSVRKRLFDDITMQKLPAGPGPQAGVPSPEVMPTSGTK